MYCLPYFETLIHSQINLVSPVAAINVGLIVPVAFNKIVKTEFTANNFSGKKNDRYIISTVDK